MNSSGFSNPAVSLRAAKVNTFPRDNLSFTPRFVDLDHDGLPDLAVTSDTTSSR